MEEPGGHMQFDLSSRRVICAHCGARSKKVDEAQGFDHWNITQFKQKHIDCVKVKVVRPVRTRL